MFELDSKLYELLALMVQVIFVSALCFIIAIPVFTLPIAVLFYCQLMANIVSDKKLFDFSNITKDKIKSIILLCVIELCSLYNSLLLARMEDYFLSRLVIAFIISVNIISCIYVLKRNEKFIISFRNAFFYSIGYFHKTILLIFLYIQAMNKMNGLLPVYAVIIFSIVSFYYIFKMNFSTIFKNR